MALVRKRVRNGRQFDFVNWDSNQYRQVTEPLPRPTHSTVPPPGIPSRLVRRTFPEVWMSVHAALARPVFRTPSGRHAKPRPAWPRVAGRAVFLITALFCIAAVAFFGWPPVLLVVPAAAFALLVAGVAKLRTASRKIDAIFAEELAEGSGNPG